MNLEYSSWNASDSICKYGEETATALCYLLCCNINSFKGTLKVSDNFKNKQQKCMQYYF